jgi:hypothetical protein
MSLISLDNERLCSQDLIKSIPLCVGLSQVAALAVLNSFIPNDGSWSKRGKSHSTKFLSVPTDMRLFHETATELFLKCRSRLQKQDCSPSLIVHLKDKHLVQERAPQVVLLLILRIDHPPKEDRALLVHT